METKVDLTPIREFCQEVKLRHRLAFIDWTSEFRSAGYHHAQPAQLDNWSEMHQWCNHHIGCENYAWNGSNFWFVREHDAVLFALRWS